MYKIVTVAIISILLILAGYSYYDINKNTRYYDIKVYREGELLIEYNNVCNIYEYDHGSKLPGGSISFDDKDGKKHKIEYTNEMIIKDEK